MKNLLRICSSCLESFSANDSLHILFFDELSNARPAIQNLVFNIKREKMILMEIQKSSDINYSYKCNIPCEEMEKDENEVNITTEALIFTI